MKRYPHYKDSGVAWLGEVPQHWVITSFKRYCDIQLGKMLQPAPNAESDMQVSYLKAAHVQWQGIDYKDLPEMWISPKDLEKFQVQSGDLLVCEGGEVGRSAILGNIETPTIIQNALHRIRGNKNTFVPFVNYMLRHIADSQWFEILCNKATIAHLTGEKLGDLSLALPPLSEQQAIAAWLDGKTTQIDTLIRRKQTLLEKLAEKRGALISHAVTKGLNPAAAMKDSGVTWLGDVPQHWEVWKITHGFNRIGSGTTPKSDNSEYYDDGEIPWITTSELREAVIYDTKDKVTTKAIIDYSALKLYPRDSLAFAMYGATIGRLGILGIEAAVNQACCVFAESTIFDTKFVFYWLLMRKPILISLSNGGGQPNLSQDDLKKIRIPIPPLQEQESIAAFLDTETARIDAQRLAVETALAKLQEYRSALISHAVTGKIDIRELSAAKEKPL